MKPESSPLLSGIVVHWRNEEQLSRLVAAWPEDDRFELVVVNNGSRAPLEVGGATLLEPGRNLGFSAGVNHALRVARAPHVLILNPDIFPEGRALSSLLDGFARLGDASGLAPRLVGPGGQSQALWQLRSVPSLLELLAHTAFLPTAPRTRKEPEAGLPVEQPAAACLAMRRETLDRLDGLDERFFPAWFEDVDLAKRLKEAGGVIRYWPEASFRHDCGGSVAELGYPFFLAAYCRNLVRYLQKHYHSVWSLVAQILLAIASPLRILLLPLRQPSRATTRRDAAIGLCSLTALCVTGWRYPRAIGEFLRTGEPSE